MKCDNIQIRKVKALGDRARKQADEQGLKENDLVIVKTVIAPSQIPKYEITKIEGSPTEFLQKKYLKMRNSMKRNPKYMCCCGFTTNDDVEWSKHLSSFESKRVKT